MLERCAAAMATSELPIAGGLTSPLSSPGILSETMGAVSSGRTLPIRDVIRQLPAFGSTADGTRGKDACPEDKIGRFW